MKKIIFLIPYFGKWPIWMELYLDSIKRNESVNFHFITDCETSILNEISNISFEKTTFFDYVIRFKNILGNDINIPNPYKICDLRPFFGLIHFDKIQNYDYFGWTDLDVIFGDIRTFYTIDILEKYEVLSTHNNRLSGHMALLKNNVANRQIGYKIYAWRKALQNPDFVGIDEHGITNALRMTFFDKFAEKFNLPKENKLLNFLRRIKTKKHYFVEQYTTPFTSIPWIDGSLNSSQPDEWYYEEGIVKNSRDSNRCFIYLHLMNFKSSKWRADNTLAPWEKLNNYYDVRNINNKIRIDKHGIREIK